MRRSRPFRVLTGHEAHFFEELTDALVPPDPSCLLGAEGSDAAGRLDDLLAGAELPKRVQLRALLAVFAVDCALPGRLDGTTTRAVRIRTRFARWMDSPLHTQRILAEALRGVVLLTRLGSAGVRASLGIEPGDRVLARKRGRVLSPVARAELDAHAPTAVSHATVASVSR